jgi:Tfp pilus assembly protein PilE
VELLVVVVIIGIIAGISMAALQGVQQSARAEKTRATITKLHAIISGLYESYQTRRVAVTPSGPAPAMAARAKLFALRDLMRLEMPERLNDVTLDPLPNPYAAQGRPIPRPALSQAYRARYLAARNRTVNRYGSGTNRDEGMERMGRYGSAECLYMIVMLSDPEARSQFADSEIGDADDDGLPEFLDGWGNPIMFLRSAPGLEDSDLQLTVPDPMDATDRGRASVKDHDPFDTNIVDYNAWRLVPYIYSAGADGIYDVSVGGPTFVYTGSPYVLSDGASPVRNGRGADSRNSSVTAMDPPDPAPQMTPASQDHYDNFDNHHLEVR